MSFLGRYFLTEMLTVVVSFLGNLVEAATGIIAISWSTFRPLIAGAALFFGIKKLTSKPSPSPQTA